MSVRCCHWALKCHEGCLICWEVVKVVWCVWCRDIQTHKHILVDKDYGFWDKMRDGVCMWLAFICILLTLQSLCHEYIFKYLNILRCIQVELSRQRWLLSSWPQQTPWCKLQGIPHAHIPLPKRQYQQVCYWQPMVHQNRPTIKHICSKIYDILYIIVLPFDTSLGIQSQMSLRVCNATKLSHEIRNTSVSVNSWEFL